MSQRISKCTACGGDHFIFYCENKCGIWHGDNRECSCLEQPPPTGNKKNSSACILGVLCLNLFLLVGMLFSPISIWELNCYKWKDRQVITTFKWKMYGRILFTYFIFISNNNSCKKGVHRQFHVTDITFRGQILELKLFLTYFPYTIFCSKFLQVFITWYLTISRKETDFILKSCQYFCF